MKENGVILSNASTNVVNFLKANMSLPHAAYAIARWQLQRVFLEIKVGDVNRNHGFDYRIVIGFCSMLQSAQWVIATIIFCKSGIFFAYFAIVLMEHQVFVCP